MIVANELQEQREYNNQPHPNKKQYKGMSRMDVFLHHINPDLPKLDISQLAKYIGVHVKTSIRRSQYVTVQYEKYQLESPDVLNRLAPNNYKVDAYYIPTAENEITEVHIFQNDQLISTCKPVPTFNRANAEWTDKDKAGYTEATKYISQFDKMVKDDTLESLQKVAIIKKTVIKPFVPKIVHEVEKEDKEITIEMPDHDYERKRALADI